MQLKIEHIAKRLPYGLRIITPEGEKVLKGVDTAPGNVIGLLYWVNTKRSVSFHVDCKPILFPLSSIEQEITIKGQTFVPKDRLDQMCLTVFYEAARLFEIHGVVSSPYAIYRQLLEWHVDTDSLIPAGLAISVFDLPKNPYE